MTSALLGTDGAVRMGYKDRLQLLTAGPSLIIHDLGDDRLGFLIPNDYEVEVTSSGLVIQPAYDEVKSCDPCGHDPHGESDEVCMYASPQRRKAGDPYCGCKSKKVEVTQVRRQS